MENLFKLTFKDNKEFLTIARTGKQIEFDILGLTSKILQMRFQNPDLCQNDPEEIIQQLNIELTGSRQPITVIDLYVKSGSVPNFSDIDGIYQPLKEMVDKLTPIVMLVGEIHSLYEAAATWFHPYYSERTNEIINNIGWNVNTGFFYGRSRELISYPQYLNGTLIKNFESNSLLALCWGEIWWALEKQEIKCSVCYYCGSVFFPPKNNLRKATCGNKDCKKKHVIDQHGGLEQYKEWERDRHKKKNIGGKRGRPKKVNDKGVRGSAKKSR